MNNTIPRHALTFMYDSAKLARQYGLKKGVAKASSKVNPALLVIEAAVSVFEAVNSFINLRNAKEQRDGLKKLIPHEKKRLQIERELLAEQLNLAKEELEQKRDLQKRLGELVFSCGQACRTALTELHAMRSSDLPDIDDFDSQLEKLESVWMDLQGALQIYNETKL